MPHLTINSKHFQHNHQIIAQVIPQQKIAIVLKDNAYGHGILEIAHLAKQANIQTAFVKNIQEALKIQHHFKEITILYPNFKEIQGIQSKNSTFCTESTCKTALEIPHLHFCASSLEALQMYPSQTSIELEVDSGMHRNGIAKDSLKTAFSLIQSQHLKLKGVFTHNGFGDDLSSAFYTQNAEFLSIKQEVLHLCNHYKIPYPRFHSLNSSGAFRAVEANAHLPKECQDSLFRIGIAFYGYLCSKIPQVGLKPVAALYAQKISTLQLKKGATIGYSGVSTLKDIATISTYDIGYGDGLFRLKENMQLTTAEGFRILPYTNMDCISIASDAQEVCVFNDASIFAKAFNTIPYEILTHLHGYIPRIIV